MISSKSLIIVVISVLVVALIYSTPYTFIVFAAPKGSGFDNGVCTNSPETLSATCCWLDVDKGETVCQTCSINLETGDFEDCDPEEIQYKTTPPTTGEGVLPQDGVLEQPPTPPPSGPAAPLQDGGVLQQPPSEGVAPPLTRGQGVLPQDGVLQQPPADEGTEAAPRTVEPPSTADEATPCPEGQVLDEEAGLCVLEEPEVVDVPEQSEPEEPEQQSSEEEDSSGDNSNNDNDNNN